jgi:hypothetical protein
MSEDHSMPLLDPLRRHASASPMGRVALAAGVILGASRASAHPCVTCGPAQAGIGWWDERPLDVGATDDHAPRVDVDGTGTSSRFVVAWERRSSGSGDIWLATSDDGGCTWSSRAITSGPEDDRSPDVAVSIAQDTIALAFVRDGVVMATLSADGGGSFEPPAALDPLAAPDAGATPRLALIAIGTGVHAHVAWTEGGRLHLARRPGIATWLAGPPLSDRFTGFSSWAAADISADTRSRDAALDSGVMIVATALAGASTTAEVFAVRSNDSGADFFGDPATPLTADVPARVSDARSGFAPWAAVPQLDVSDDGTGEFYAWEAVTYSDFGAPQPGWRADARAEEGAGPTTIAPWNDTAPDDVSPGPRGVAAGIAVVPNPLSRPPSPEAHLFGQQFASEIVGWRASLDSSVPAWFVETCPTYALTGLAPPRSSGSVVPGSFSADEDLSNVVVAWEDTRDGGSSIWWKRTDTVAEPPTAVTASPGDCASGGGLAVSWTLSPATCDADHVRLEYGRMPGTYEASVDVPPVPPARIAGLVEGATYFVRATLVDEACNEASAAEVSGAAASCAVAQCPLPVGGSLRVRRAPTDADVSLAWAPPPTDATHDAATSYDVYRSVTRAQDGFALRFAGPAAAGVDSGAAAAGQPPRHYYLIVSRNSCGTSGDEPLP